MGERRYLGTALGHAFGQARDASRILPFNAEVVAGDVQVGAVAGACRLDIGGLLAGLPAAGQDDRALDGRALLAITCCA